MAFQQLGAFWFSLLIGMFRLRPLFSIVRLLQQKRAPIQKQERAHQWKNRFHSFLSIECAIVSQQIMRAVSVVRKALADKIISAESLDYSSP